MKVAVFYVFVLLLVACAYAKTGSITITNKSDSVVKGTLTYQPEGSDGGKDSEKFESTGPIEVGSKGKLKIPDGATDIFVLVEYKLHNIFTDIFGEAYDEPVTVCFTVEATESGANTEEKDC